MNWEVQPRRVINLLGLVVLWPVLVIGTPLVLFALAVIIAPGVDELVGGISRHALYMVQDHREGSRTVREIVAERYRNPKWRAYHSEYLEETFVRCDATSNTGQPIAMAWVVISEPEWSGWLPRFRVTATAHNHAAYDIAHSLYRPGHALYGSADMANW